MGVILTTYDTWDDPAFSDIGKGKGEKEPTKRCLDPLWLTIIGEGCEGYVFFWIATYLLITLPKTNSKSPYKWWFPIGISFSRGPPFSGDMLVSGRVRGWNCPREESCFFSPSSDLTNLTPLEKGEELMWKMFFRWGLSKGLASSHVYIAQYQSCLY